jgi:hypothetical protein
MKLVCSEKLLLQIAMEYLQTEEQFYLDGCNEYNADD